MLFFSLSFNYYLNFQDKITFKVDDYVAKYKVLSEKKAVFEERRKDALRAGKEVLAQKLVLEVLGEMLTSHIKN